jgi:DNA-binding NtrC family response regulator
MQSDAKANSKRAKRSLLLVDPDPLLRWSIETHLQRWFELVAAENHDDALLRLGAARFDAMIVSAEFGALTGAIEAEARRRNPDVKIVRLTTRNMSPSASAPIANLEKPFRLEALSQILGVSALNAGASRHVR